MSIEEKALKISLPLINSEELQRIDEYYNELVDGFLKQYTKEKDLIIAQRIMMNLKNENQKLKELQCTFQGTGCQNKMKKYKEVIDKAIDFIEEYNRNRNCFKWNEQDYIEVIDEIYSILKEVYR